jgi:AcrR family transcriptional regulator
MTASSLTAIRGRPTATYVASPFRAALIDLCFESGFSALTVEALCRRAGVGRTAFRRWHASLEDCFFEVCRGELRRYRRRAITARAGLSEWPSRLRVTTYTLYRFLAEDERRRRFTLVDARVAGERSKLLLEKEIEALLDLIDEGRDEPSAPPRLTRATAESLAGGIFNELYLAAAHHGPLPREAHLVPEIMYSAVLPYLGPAAAAEELELPSPPPMSGE